MEIDIITLFPEMFEGPFSHSIVKRAKDAGILRIGFVNPRDFARDRHRTVDDRPFGGGPGMVLMPEPVYQALRRTRRDHATVVHLTPRGHRLDQGLVRELSAIKHLVLLCGHYEGIDERVASMADLEVSLGDFVLSGGEIAAMAVVDAVCRLLPGVLKKAGAVEEESFSTGLLEAPHYTRPRIWRGKRVPAVLLCGDHARIAQWRRQKALELTRRLRPDLSIRSSDQTRPQRTPRRQARIKSYNR